MLTGSEGEQRHAQARRAEPAEGHALGVVLQLHFGHGVVRSWGVLETTVEQRVRGAHAPTHALI